MCSTKRRCFTKNLKQALGCGSRFIGSAMKEVVEPIPGYALPFQADQTLGGQMFGVYNWFHANSLNFPNKTALVHAQERISYNELRQCVNKLSYGLHQVGVKRASRVGMLLGNGRHFIETFYACQKLGTFLVPFNFRFHEREMLEALEVSHCEYFIFSEEFRDKVESLKRGTKQNIVWVSVGKAKAEELAYENLMANAAQDWDTCADTPPDAEVLAIFTGGTTGKSKGAVHTQQGLLLQVIPRMIGYTPDLVFLISSPLFHIGGLAAMLSTVCAGGTMVLTGKFDAHTILETVAREKITHMFLIPPNLGQVIADHPARKNYDLSSIELIKLGSSYCPAEIIELLFDVFPNAVLSNAYSNSEFSASISMTYTREMAATKPHLLRSLGKPVPMCQIKLLDEQGHEVPLGTSGEAWGKTWGSMSGYINAEAPIENGWIPTGDIMRMDEDGYYYFLDRKKDMIKTGGENVYTVEVEAALRSHPDVVECAVVGLPDTNWGEIVCAAVVINDFSSLNADSLIEHCKQNIASYKKPRQIFFIKKLPRSNIGKVNKVDLKQDLLSRVNDS